MTVNPLTRVAKHLMLSAGVIVDTTEYQYPLTAYLIVEQSLLIKGGTIVSGLLEIIKGDDITFVVTVRDSDDALVVLTGATIKFTVREEWEGTNIMIELSNADQAEIEDSDLANGEFKIHIVPLNTSSLNPRYFVYDIEITLASKVSTVIRGKLLLKEDVTK